MTPKALAQMDGCESVPNGVCPLHNLDPTCPKSVLPLGLAARPPSVTPHTCTFCCVSSRSAASEASRGPMVWFFSVWISCRGRVRVSVLGSSAAEREVREGEAGDPTPSSPGLWFAHVPPAAPAPDWAPPSRWLGGPLQLPGPPARPPATHRKLSPDSQACTDPCTLLWAARDLGTGDLVSLS